jgi:hypothetical protein
MHLKEIFYVANLDSVSVRIILYSCSHLEHRLPEGCTKHLRIASSDASYQRSLKCSDQ